MNKEKLIIPIILTAAVLITIAVGIICVPQTQEAIRRFNETATAKLGTNNFTITSWDGYLQAVTPDGAKYPTDLEMDQYFQNQLNNTLILIGYVIVGGLIIMAVVGVYAYKKGYPLTQSNADETTKKDQP